MQDESGPNLEICKKCTWHRELKEELHGFFEGKYTITHSCAKGLFFNSKMVMFKKINEMRWIPTECPFILEQTIIGDNNGCNRNKK
jgi:hypothetical protein